VHNDGWWGEGEIKFYIDGDREFPTICGTGTEDYFCGSYDFDSKRPDGSGPVHRAHDTLQRPGAVIRETDTTMSNSVRTLSLAHHDPVRFETDLRSPSRRSAGVRAAAICRFRMTSPLSLLVPAGSRTRRSPSSRIKTIWRSTEVALRCPSVRPRLRHWVAQENVWHGARSDHANYSPFSQADRRV